MVLEITIRRVAKGLSTGRPVYKLGGFTRGIVPADGFIISSNEPGAIPIYVRDTDLEIARDLAEVKSRSIVMTAESWDGGIGW